MWLLWVACGLGLLLCIGSTLIDQLNFKRFRLCAVAFPMTTGPLAFTTYAVIGLGAGSLGGCTNTLQDSRFGISVPPYADILYIGGLRVVGSGCNCLNIVSGIIFVSAPESVLHKIPSCLPFDVAHMGTSSSALPLRKVF